jgi:hypothetical protein
VKGTNCDKLLLQGSDSLCLSNPCWNGGTCRDLGNDWRCDCPPGKLGKNCRSITTAPCLFNNPCRNNAICMASEYNGFFCFCVGDWTGRYCENKISLCNKPNSCYNGGSCINDQCQCRPNFYGYQCETYIAPNRDRVIKIYNKGWYTADLKLYYEVQEGIEKRRIVQTGHILGGQNYAFYVPYTVNYDGAYGVTLVVHAIAGKQVMSQRVKTSPQCYHVWGTTLIPYWSSMPC